MTRAKYDRPVAEEKPKIVVPTACMRFLLVMMNAVCGRHAPWCSPALTSWVTPVAAGHYKPS